MNVRITEEMECATRIQFKESSPSPKKMKQNYFKRLSPEIS